MIYLRARFESKPLAARLQLTFTTTSSLARSQSYRYKDSIHNEAQWIPAYFHSKAEAWKKFMVFSVQESLKGHAAYASFQVHSWEELSRSSAKALAPIRDTPLKYYKVD